MSKVTKETQLNIIVPNDIGIGARVFGAIAQSGIYIKSFCAYGMEKQAHFILLTDKPAQAVKVLTGAGYPVTTDEVLAVQVSDRVGKANELTEQLAKEGIDIEFCYATASNAGSTEATAIFKTNDNDRAMKVLSKLV